MEMTHRVIKHLVTVNKIVLLLSRNLGCQCFYATTLAYIKAETLTEELKIKDQIEAGIDISFDDVNTKLFIQKH